MSSKSLYEALILDHSRHPRSYGSLKNFTHHAIEENVVCGDKVSLYLRVKSSLIERSAFTGEGCAICVASASIMTEQIQMMTIGEAGRMLAGFRHLMNGKRAAGDPALGKLSTLSCVRAFPVRVKCALLPWDVLKICLSATGFDAQSS